MAKEKKQKKEYLTVSIHMKIDGQIYNMEEVKYQRGRETYCYTLDDFARTIFMWEKQFSGTTYAMDDLLPKAEKVLEKKEGETAQSVFEKYWVNLKQTIDQEFIELNKGNKDDEYPLYPEKNDYLTHLIAHVCDGFNYKPLPVKYGFLYWLFKYVMNSSLNEIEQEIADVPDEIRSIVDNIVIEKK
jgi:hypothetical protein